MSTLRIVDESRIWVDYLEIESEINRIYSYDDGSNGTPWHTDSEFAQEAWDFFTSRAITDIRRNPAEISPDFIHPVTALMIKWMRMVTTMTGGGTAEGTQISGAHIMSWWSVDFACWLTRLPDATLSAHGAAALGEMVRSGSTEEMTLPVSSPGGLVMASASSRVYVDGVYTERFLQAWGDDDLRILDFYAAGGAVNREMALRCVVDGVEPDFAVAVEAA